MARSIEGRASDSLRRLLTAALAIALGALCCQERSEASGGETHFLTHCDESASCGAELHCLHNVCTLPCDDPAACSAFPNAECVPASQPDLANYCDVRCSADADCATLSSVHRCSGGACRAGDTLECPSGELEANQVLLIGDTFFGATHQITAFLEDLARNADALSAGDRYRDNSRVVANGLALPGEGLADQYAAGVSEGDVRLVIMNGGGADVLLGACESPGTDCPGLPAAADAARELLDGMAADGVLNVVYVFYPDPLDATVREKMDALRPLIQDACEGSSTPCHWLDLRTAFAGHYDEYIQPDGLNPTAAGSQASARAIWETLRLNCIAQ
jgi:hypothetical protein